MIHQADFNKDLFQQNDLRHFLLSSLSISPSFSLSFSLYLSHAFVLVQIHMYSIYWLHLLFNFVELLGGEDGKLFHSFDYSRENK